METWYTRRGKRWFDLAIAVPFALVALPAGLAVAAVVRIALGSPVLFRQKRPGLHGRPFTLLKFRTMADTRDAQGRPLPDGQRLGTLGRTLRSLSVDELPEIWNVLRGEMSFVGPRPLLMQYLQRYNAEQRRRHDVLPGLTGWAQVRHEYTSTVQESMQKLQFDLYYIKHLSLALDVFIILETIKTVLVRRGS